MLRSLRPVAAVVLALAFVAGPASAACLHGADHGTPMEAMGHEMPMSEHAPADGPHDSGEMPPCHDEPAPDVPAPPVDGCASACCAVQATVETPAPLPVAEAVVLLAVVATDVRAEPAPVPVPTPEGPPLRPRTRLHVELERFLI